MKPKIISYELNEVPWRIIDEYTCRYPKSNIAKLLNRAQTFTTITHDTGELHPWSTWPSFHRGVYNDQHKINFINQQIKTDFPPIWEILSNNNISTGVFGSLQSYPVKSQKHSFYIPDTFSQTPKTHPKIYETFQAFNLSQTQLNSAVPKDLALGLNLIPTTFKLLSSGLSLATSSKIAIHLVRERINPWHRTYRSTMQAPLAFDFFKHAYNLYKPQFATFFSNHVAGMLHRYWKQSFPQDFKISPDSLSPRDNFLAKNIFRAMNIADQQVGYLTKLAKKESAILLISSSMGQDSIDWGDYFGEIRIENLSKFCKAIGYTRPAKNNLAMHPDFALSFENQEDLQLFKKLASNLLDEYSKPLIKFKISQNTLNLSLKASKAVIENNAFFSATAQPVSFKHSGIVIFHRDQGTAYHVPEGIHIIYNPYKRGQDTRQNIQSIEIAPSILSAYNIPAPDYMQPRNPIISSFFQN